MCVRDGEAVQMRHWEIIRLSARTSGTRTLEDLWNSQSFRAEKPKEPPELGAGFWVKEQRQHVDPFLQPTTAHGWS